MATANTKERTATQSAPRQAPAGNLPATQEAKRVHPLVAFRDYATERVDTLQSSLPKHIGVDVFLSVAMTALQKKPELLKCTKQSLWNACIQAAQDGLLPDGREGAIAPYGQNVDGKRSAEIATWMPMVEGLRKKARNSGEILNWEVHSVRARDHFRFALGDEAFIEHEPYFGTEDPGDVVGVYSIAKLKGGEISRDVMSIRDVKKIEAKSSARNGPWKDPTFFGEMAKKTIARRHYKQLPHSSGLDKLIARDDVEFDLDHKADDQIEQRQVRRLASTTAAFDSFGGSDVQTIEHDAETGEVIDDDFGGDDPQDEQPVAQETQKPAPAKPAPKEDPISTGRPKPADVQKPATQAKTTQTAADASPAGDAQPAAATGTATAGAQDGEAGHGDMMGDAADADVDHLPEDEGAAVGEDVRRWPKGATPTTAAEYEKYAETKIGDFTKPEDVAPWWKSAPEITLRKACKLSEEQFKAIQNKAMNRRNELTKK